MTEPWDITGLELVTALQRGGFSVVGQRGNHVRLALLSDAARRVIVPVHAGRRLKHGVVISILDHAGWTLEDVRTFLSG